MPKEISKQDPYVPLDLRAYVESRDLYEWAVLLTMAVHDRKILDGNLTAEQIAELSDMKRAKVFLTLKGLHERGWVQKTSVPGEPTRWSRSVPRMSWDEAHQIFAKILGYGTQPVHHMDTPRPPHGHPPSTTWTPPVHTVDGSNIHTRPSDKTPIQDQTNTPPPPPRGSEKPAGQTKTQDQPDPGAVSNPGKLVQSSGDKTSCLAYRCYLDERRLAGLDDGGRYRPSSDDYKAMGDLMEARKTEAEWRAAIQKFFDARRETNYGMTFSSFAKVRDSFFPSKSTLAKADPYYDAKCRYYNSWDPRHPKFKNVPFDEELKRHWERDNGRKWVPPADFDPKIHLDSRGQLK